MCGKHWTLILVFVSRFVEGTLRSLCGALWWYSTSTPEEISIHSLSDQRVECTISEHEAHVSLICLWNHRTENKGTGQVCSCRTTRTHTYTHQTSILALYMLRPWQAFGMSWALYMWWCNPAPDWAIAQMIHQWLVQLHTPVLTSEKGSAGPDGALT